MTYRVYLRISPRPGPSEPGLEVQLADCLAWIDRETARGAVVQDESGRSYFYGPAAQAANADHDDACAVTVYRDRLISRTLALHERPAFSELLADLRRKDVIVVQALDRLAGDMLIQLTAEQVFKDTGARLVSTKGQGTGGEDADDIFIRRIMTAAAELEVHKVRARTKRALAQLKQAGLVYGNIPYGFRRDGKRLVPDSNEQEVIARVRTLSQAGLTQHEIVKRLKIEGVRSRRGNPLAQSAISEILKRIKST